MLIECGGATLVISEYGSERCRGEIICDKVGVILLISVIVDLVTYRKVEVGVKGCRNLAHGIMPINIVGSIETVSPASDLRIAENYNVKAVEGLGLKAEYLGVLAIGFESVDVLGVFGKSGDGRLVGVFSHCRLCLFYACFEGYVFLGEAFAGHILRFGKL